MINYNFLSLEIARKAIVFFVLCFLISCSAVRRQHIRQPRIESKAAIIRWLHQNNLDEDTYALSLSPEFFFDLELSSKLRINPILYPSRSQSILLYDGCTTDSCMRNLNTWFSVLQPLSLSTITNNNNSLIREYSEKFEKIPLLALTKFLRTLDGKQVSNFPDTSVNFLLILPFAKFFGDKKQVEDLKSTIATLSANKYSKFRIYLLSMDKQEWWGKEWNKKIDFSINVVK